MPDCNLDVQHCLSPYCTDVTYIPASDRADGGVPVAQISQSAAINAALASQERKQ